MTMVITSVHVTQRERCRQAATVSKREKQSCRDEPQRWDEDYRSLTANSTAAFQRKIDLSIFFLKSSP